ncbi:hypothetical protein SUSP_000691 [Sulfurospirillum sp. 'SP']|nr:hypothetical protein [Sulfurospirillum sp. 'SP']WNY98273.1 hypothetical protein SUSP_000691 [Sulfurospirillum sp. 'SP']
MKKMLFFFLLLSPFCFADYFMPSLNKCVTDFWIDQNTGTYKYILSNDITLVYSTSTNVFNDFQIGWDYNATSGLCTREKSNNELGLQNGQFTFLMALTGLLVSFSFVFPFLTIFARKGSNQ